MRVYLHTQQYYIKQHPYKPDTQCDAFAGNIAPVQLVQPPCASMDAQRNRGIANEAGCEMVEFRRGLRWWFTLSDRYQTDTS